MTNLAKTLAFSLTLLSCGAAEASKPLLFPEYDTYYGYLTPAPKSDVENARLIVRLTSLPHKMTLFHDHIDPYKSRVLAFKNCKIIFTPVMTIVDGPGILVKSTDAGISCRFNKWKYKKITVDFYRENGSQGIFIPCSLSYKRLACPMNTPIPLRIEVTEELTDYFSTP